MHKLTTTILILLFSFPFLAATQSLESLFPDLEDSALPALIEGTLLTSDTTIFNGLRYAPEMLKKLYNNSNIENKETIGFTVEAIALVPIPKYLRSASEDTILLHLVNTLRSVSTQNGITYISHRKGDTPYPLFKKSYHVKEKGSFTPLDDPVLEEIPNKITDIVYQRDTSFGGNFYQHTYMINENVVFLTVENISTLSVFGIFPAVPKNTLNINFFVTILDEGIICYTQAHISDKEPILKILGFEVHLPSAFQRRITALQRWFADNFS